MSGESSKSLLPLVEILISIGIFAVAVVLTLNVFLLAKFLGDRTSDTARAIFELQNVAENIKTMETDAEMESYIKNELNGDISDGVYILYYDEHWSLINGGEKAAFSMKIEMDRDAYDSGGLYRFRLDFYKMEPYPFINEKQVAKDPDFVPMLASVNASKFILN